MKKDYLLAIKPLAKATMQIILVMVGCILIWGNKTIFLWVNQHITPEYGIFAEAFSFLGESVPMGTIVFCAFLLSIRRGLAASFSWLLGSCLSWLFKLWLAKDALRPQKFFRNQGFEINTVPDVEVHHYHSFPSGHTLTVFTILFLIPYLLPKMKPVWKWLIGFLALGCGLSRMVLAQHWPIDVLAGIIMGSLAGFISCFLFSSFKGPEWMENSYLNN